MRLNNFFDIVSEKYKLLPEKMRLFIAMFIAANTAATAIYGSLFLAVGETDYWGCLGFFLAARVVLFMANPNMPLTNANVAFMSSERTLWNLATLAILAVMILAKKMIS